MDNRDPKIRAWAERHFIDLSYPDTQRAYADAASESAARVKVLDEEIRELKGCLLDSINAFKEVKPVILENSYAISKDDWRRFIVVTSINEGVLTALPNKQGVKS